MQEAETLLVADPETAERKLRKANELDANNHRAQIVLSELLLSQGNADECAQILASLEKRGFLEPEAEKVKAALELHRVSESAGDITSCQAKVDADPDNLQLQLRLGEALAAKQRFVESLEILLLVVQNSSGELRDNARQTMVDIFRLMPADSPEVSEYRRKLSMALY